MRIIESNSKRTLRAEPMFNNHPTRATEMARRNSDFLAERDRKRRLRRRIFRITVRVAFAAAILAVLYVNL